MTLTAEERYALVQGLMGQVIPVGDVVGMPPRVTSTGMAMTPLPGLNLTAEQLRKARDIQADYPNIDDHTLAYIIKALIGDIK